MARLILRVRLHISMLPSTGHAHLVSRSGSTYMEPQDLKMDSIIQVIDFALPVGNKETLSHKLSRFCP